MDTRIHRWGDFATGNSLAGTCLEPDWESTESGQLEAEDLPYEPRAKPYEVGIGALGGGLRRTRGWAGAPQRAVTTSVGLIKSRNASPIIQPWATAISVKNWLCRILMPSL